MTDVYITGTVDRIIYENEQSYFKILSVFIEDSDSTYEDSEIVVTGTFAAMIEGDDYTFWGKLVQHPRYGEQLAVSRYEKAKPSSSGLVAFFSSNRFKGIGKKIAQHIVDLYGDNAIEAILESPEQLDQITSLKASVKTNLIDTLKENYGNEHILAELAQLGLTNRLASRILESHGQDSLNVLKENPYQLVFDIQGISFKACDQLAKNQGIDATSPDRFQAAILYSLSQNAFETGDTYMMAENLLSQTQQLLQSSRPQAVALEEINNELQSLIDDNRILTEQDCLFDPHLYRAERSIADSLKRILNKPLRHTFSEKKLAQALSEIEAQEHITYDSKQKEAIMTAVSRKIFLLTGGPGTGKTTVVNGIIALYEKLHQLDLNEDNPILLAAPTGRAARRLSELTNLPSATLHRHLGLTLDSDETSEATQDLDCRLIIIDEFSMVDTWLTNQLFQALPIDCQIIIVGDSDQLPSVGPGQVLADLLRVEELPKIRLETIFRQDDDSTIITLANHIRKGEIPDDLREKKADRSYIEATAQQVPALIEQIVLAAQRSGIASEDIQILAPMYRGQAGITALNQSMQNLLNPLQGQEFTFKDLSFRRGDKVIHLVNDAENNIFNGDIGRITDLIPSKDSESKQDELVIAFEGGEVSYARNEWNRLNLAYAMSIHKSQGSEFPVIILPLTHQSSRMLQRNLIYTAITRAKSKLILLGEYQAFIQAITHQGAKRHTYLFERLTHTTKNSSKGGAPDTPDATFPSDKRPDTSYRLSAELIGEIDPMIGLTQADIDEIFD